MKNLRNIVVAIDFSQHSQSALREGRRLGEEAKAKLHVISVIGDTGLKELVDGLGGDHEKLQTDTAGVIRAKLEALVSEAGVGDMECDIVTPTGDPYNEILRIVRKTNADLLVMGSRGTNRVRDGAGSTAIRCIRKLQAKVMLVRRAHAEPFKVVGAFVDLSKKSESVVKQAAYMARTNGAELRLFHVYLPPWRIAHYGAPSRAYTPETKERHKKQVIDKMQDVLRLSGENSNDLKVEYSLIESSEKIVGIDDFIAGAGVDLVVVSTPSRSGVRAVLLRTIAEHIIRTSPCSVLAVKS